MDWEIKINDDEFKTIINNLLLSQHVGNQIKRLSDDKDSLL